MESTSKVPNVPIAKFKRTKIIATLGPSTNSYESVLALITAGANGIRLNFSHGSQSERIEQIKWVRKASKSYGKPIAIIQDLQGPKMRLGDFDGFLNVEAGQTLSFAYEANYESTGHIPTQYDLTKKVKRGERMYIYDGKVKFTITSVKDGVVHARAENEGMLIKRKGINLPDTDFAGDIITPKDKKDLAFGSTHDVDYVAMSFVQTASDINKLRGILRNLGSSARIIAKIETKAAIENLEAIIEESDAVMVARGDLAIETSPESVPLVQREIVGLGLKYAKPTIVATQMLASMAEQPEATRAEVSDIATAVIVGTDCLMLADETAIGRYPIEAVKVMKSIIVYTDRNNPVKPQFVHVNLEENGVNRQRAICKNLVALANDIHADAIVAETRSGTTALQVAARRSDIPLIAVTPDSRVAQQLAIVYGCKSYVRPNDKLAATKLTNWLRDKKILNKGSVIVTASGKHPGMVGTTDTIKVRILE
jgi:pyruvate kinase